MNEYVSTVATPDELTRQRFFDGAASYPYDMPLFLLTPVEGGPRHHQDLGRMVLDAAGVYHHLSVHKMRGFGAQCGRLRETDYLTSDGVPDGNFFSVNPSFLVYKKGLATMLLEKELDCPPERHLGIIFGGVRQLYSRGVPGIPSLSLALYRRFLATDPHYRIPRAPSTWESDFAGHALSAFDPKRVYSRITHLVRKTNILEWDKNYVYLSRAIVPFIADIVQSLDLFDQNIQGPAYQAKMAERTEAVMSSSRIRVALSRSIMSVGSYGRAQPPSQTATEPQDVPQRPVRKKAASKPKPQETPPPPRTITRHQLPVLQDPYPPDWVTSAACRDNPEAVTFNPQDTRAAQRAQQKFCKRCPVALPCLRAALLLGDQKNIAYLTPPERDQLTPEERAEVLGVTIAPFKRRHG